MIKKWSYTEKILIKNKLKKIMQREKNQEKQQAHPEQEVLLVKITKIKNKRITINNNNRLRAKIKKINSITIRINKGKQGLIVLEMQYPNNSNRINYKNKDQLVQIKIIVILRKKLKDCRLSKVKKCIQEKMEKLRKINKN